MQISVKTTEFKKHTRWEIKNQDEKTLISSGSAKTYDDAIQDINEVLERYGLSSYSWEDSFVD